MRINQFTPEIQGNLNRSVGSAPKTRSDSFLTELKSKMQEVNQLQNQSDAAMAEGSVKGASDIHETMIQLEEADISMRLLTRVRNKALDAYHEMMRMQF